MEKDSTVDRSRVDVFNRSFFLRFSNATILGHFQEASFVCFINPQGGKKKERKKTACFVTPFLFIVRVSEFTAKLSGSAPIN